MKLFAANLAIFGHLAAAPGHSESGRGDALGGQAVLEGVMMLRRTRGLSPSASPMARSPTYREPLEKISEKHQWLGWPVIRGVATLGQAMSLGVRALKFFR